MQVYFGEGGTTLHHDYRFDDLRFLLKYSGGCNFVENGSIIDSVGSGTARTPEAIVGSSEVFARGMTPSDETPRNAVVHTSKKNSDGSLSTSVVVNLKDKPSPTFFGEMYVDLDKIVETLNKEDAADESKREENEAFSTIKNATSRFSGEFGTAIRSGELRSVFGGRSSTGYGHYIEMIRRHKETNNGQISRADLCKDNVPLYMIVYSASVAIQ